MTEVAKPRILIVEDEPAIAMALEDELRNQGYEVELARERRVEALRLDLEAARAAYQHAKPGSPEFSSAQSKLAWSYQSAGAKTEAVKLARAAAATGAKASARAKMVRGSKGASHITWASSTTRPSARRS